MGNVIVPNITRTPVENGSNWGSVSVPSSPGLTGTFSEGNTITLAGSGYGTLGVTTKYDDFEDGTNGQLISARADWKTAIASGGVEPKVSSAQAYAGSLSGRSQIVATGDSAAYLDTLDFREAYISFAYRGHIESGAAATTVKGLRVHADDGPNTFTSYPGISEQEIIDQYSGNSRRFSVNPMDDTSSPNERSIYPGGLAADQWHYLEYYWKQGDAGVANGIVQSWADLSVGANESNVITNDSGVLDSWKLVMLPFFWGNGSGGDHFYDLVHISLDQGKARVMAGDNAVFSSCTKLEAMNTLTRVDGEITFKVPANTFTPASTVYIHVINSAGTSTTNYSTTVI